MRRLKTYLAVSLAVVVLALTGTIAAGNEPVLGLDLQGGISVVLAPVGKYNPDSLDVARDIIESRVNGLGVAEPEISRQGTNIVVDLPGVKDRSKARRVVGRTAELRFRSVLALVPAAGSTASTTTSTTAPTTTAAGQSSTTTTSTTTTTAPPTTTTAAANNEAAKAAIKSCDPAQLDALLATGAEIPTTPLGEDQRDACVVLKLKDGNERLFLGAVNPKEEGAPKGLTGKDVDDAKARFDSGGQGWVVDLTLNGSGQQKFNALAGVSFGKPSPQDQVSIVLDGLVYSNPAFQEASFPSGEVQISGGFDQTEAEDLATIISYGALPVQLEEQTVQDVSPTLGQDQLDAGIAAGIIGLALVALYMLVYYRILGLVVILGILISAGLTYALISYLGSSVGLTLTLAGVTGLIVSVGITVDSYVVYFERLKDEVRVGRTVRSSVDRGFQRSFKTILAADLVSLIGAGVLYFLAIGSVRGFAFYLGLSTILDLVVAYFFMHPIVSLMARRPSLVRMRGIGIAAGLDASGVTT